MSISHSVDMLTAYHMHVIYVFVFGCAHLSTEKETQQTENNNENKWQISFLGSIYLGPKRLFSRQAAKIK